MHAIGIDLGTTTSCVAVRVNGGEDILENDNGNLITPSCVAFTKSQILVGEQAEHLLMEEPENTIYSVKRIIGRRFDDPKTQEDIKRWKFKVESSPSGRPMIKIGSSRERYNIEEISGLVLDYMKRIACKRFDEDLRDAVVTVPAHFNHMQRSATKTAAELAGLKVLRIINEPTAAAIAFGLAKKFSNNRNILVYDFGGGTLDVNVLTINGSEFEVKASSGNSRLGGDDITNRLVDYFVENMKNETGKDITNDKRAMSKLLVECEKAKRELSFRFEYKFLVENITNGITLQETINRTKFVSLNEDLLGKTMDYVKDAIKESGIKKEDIHFVVPVGGSSRIPYVVEKLKNYFGKDRVKSNRNPEQTIAKGAAAYAGFLKGAPEQQISKIHLSEVTPLFLGIRMITKEIDIIVKRNSKIRAGGSKIYSNTLNYQKTAEFQIYQTGEECVNGNEYQGQFKVDISPNLTGKVDIYVEIKLDLNGIIHAKAFELGVGQSQDNEIDICGTSEKLDIVKLESKLKKLISEKRERELQQEAMNDLFSVISNLSTHEDSKVVRKCKKITQWIEENPRATLSEIRMKRREIAKFLE